MENRDRDKMNKNISSTNTPSNSGKNKSDSRVDFGEKVGRSEELNNEPGGRLGSQGSSGMKGSPGRSSTGGSSDVSSKSGGSNKIGSGQKVRGDSERGDKY